MKITEPLLAEHLVFYNMFDHIEATAPKLKTLAEVKSVAALMESMLRAHSDTEDDLFLGPLEHCFEQIGQRDAFVEEHQEMDGNLRRVQHATRLRDARKNLKGYLYRLLERYIGLFARPGDRLISLDAPSDEVEMQLSGSAALRLAEVQDQRLQADYVLLNGTLHYERDIEEYLSRLRARMSDETRIVVTYYSALWRPLLGLASRLGLRKKTPELSWLAHGDMINFMQLADFEVVRIEQKVLLPIYIPFISDLINRYLAALPLISAFCLLNVMMARPRPRKVDSLAASSVTVVVPARNEAGNIEAIVERLPKMGAQDEFFAARAPRRSKAAQFSEEE